VIAIVVISSRRQWRCRGGASTVRAGHLLFVLRWSGPGGSRKTSDSVNSEAFSEAEAHTHTHTHTQNNNNNMAGGGAATVQQPKKMWVLRRVSQCSCAAVDVTLESEADSEVCVCLCVRSSGTDTRTC
jgi:hypothetical protein